MHTKLDISSNNGSNVVIIVVVFQFVFVFATDRQAKNYGFSSQIKYVWIKLNMHNKLPSIWHQCLRHSKLCQHAGMNFLALKIFSFGPTFTMSHTADNTKACNDQMLMMHIIPRHIQWWFVNPDTFVPALFVRINEFSGLLSRQSVQKQKSVPALFVRISEISGLSKPGLTNHHCKPAHS